MAKVTVSVECSKEAYELGMGVAKFLGDVKAALADGWQVGSDVPAVISAALGDLVPAMDGLAKVKGELEEDKEAFAAACLVSGKAILGAVTK